MAPAPAQGGWLLRWLPAQQGRQLNWPAGTGPPAHSPPPLRAPTVPAAATAAAAVAAAAAAAAAVAAAAAAAASRGLQAAAHATASSAACAQRVCQLSKRGSRGGTDWLSPGRRPWHVAAWRWSAHPLSVSLACAWSHFAARLRFFTRLKFHAHSSSALVLASPGLGCSHM